MLAQTPPDRLQPAVVWGHTEILGTVSRQHSHCPPS